CLQDGIELVQQLRTEIPFFRFSSCGRLPGPFGFCFRSLLLFKRCLLVGQCGSSCCFSFLLGPCRVCRGPFRFLFQALRFGLGCLRLSRSFVGGLPALRFCGCFRPRPGFAFFCGALVGSNPCLRFFLGPCLDRHHSRFFCGLHRVTRGGFHHFAIPSLPVEV